MPLIVAELQVIDEVLKQAEDELNWNSEGSKLLIFSKAVTSKHIETILNERKTDRLDDIFLLLQFACYVIEQ